MPQCPKQSARSPKGAPGSEEARIDPGEGHIDTFTLRLYRLLGSRLMLKRRPKRRKGARNRSEQRIEISTVFDNGNAGNVVEVEEEATEGTMNTIDAHQDTQGLHLQDDVALHLAPITEVQHQDETWTHTYQEGVQTVDLTIEDRVDHPRAEDPFLAHDLFLQSVRGGGHIATMSRLDHGIAGVYLLAHHLQRDEGTIGAEDQEVHGAVIELDPLHLQMPLAHHLPEDLEGGEVLQSPLAAALLQRGVGVALHLHQGHILAH